MQEISIPRTEAEFLCQNIIHNLYKLKPLYIFKKGMSFVSSYLLEKEIVTYLEKYKSLSAIHGFKTQP